MLLLWVISAAAQRPIGWLRYAIPPDPPRYHGLPHAVVLLGDAAGTIAPEEQTAADELDRGLGHMVAGTDVVLHRFDLSQDAIVLGTTDALHRERLGKHLHGWVEKPLPEEGFRIVHLRRGIREWYVLQGGSPRAVLWAAFRFAALVAEDQQLPQDLIDTPRFPLRALDIGPAAAALPLLQRQSAAPPGSSYQPTPRSEFARLLASVGFNSVVADADSADYARLVEVLRPYGMRVWRRPVEARAQVQSASGDLAIRVPDNATLADVRSSIESANALARAVRPAGRTVLLEGALGPALQPPVLPGVVPPPTQVQRTVAVRGVLEPNIVLANEAVPQLQPLLPIASPNFGLLPGTLQAASVRVLPVGPGTLAFPAAAWAAALQTAERGTTADTTLAALLSQGDAARPTGIIGQLTVADAESLLQQPMLQANLYALGRLAWSPTLAPAAIAEEWARQTWGDDARAYNTAAHILLGSSSAATGAYAPLGLPWLTDAAGNPDPERMAQLHLQSQPVADTTAVGIDRTPTGTGETSLYPESFAATLAESAQRPPDALLLTHRLPWRYIMPDGKTLAQHLYNTAFAGAAQAENVVDAWETTQGLVDPARYAAVHAYLARAAVHADIAREVNTEWLQHTSSVLDGLGFVGNHSGRTMAAAMQSVGFGNGGALSGGQVRGDHLVCAADCTASLPFTGVANIYRVTIGYRDEHHGSTFDLLVNSEVEAKWQEASNAVSSDASTAQTLSTRERFTVNGVRLKPGDAVAVHIHATAGATPSLSFVEITRDPRWN